MLLKITSIFVLCCFLFSCTQNHLETAVAQEEPIEKLEKEMVVASEKEISENSEKRTPEIWQQYFTKAEITAIVAIKQTFDKGLGANSKDRGTPYLYTYHANRMRGDYFNKFPYTLNFPYNDKFDLEGLENEVQQLGRFITNKCGFQGKGNGEIIHYYCLKKEGPFMGLMQSLGKDNSLIASLHTDYIQQKSISKNAKQQLLMDSVENLDFDKAEHQLIYMFYQILINEERLATNKILKM